MATIRRLWLKTCPRFHDSQAQGLRAGLFAISAAGFATCRIKQRSVFPARMKAFLTTVSLALSLSLHAAPQDDQYVLGPDSQVQKGVLQGKVTQMPAWKDSKIYPGTTRDWWIYVPAQYTKDKPAAVMVFCDGAGFVKADGQFRAQVVFDNLIA